ncbi:MAG: hypothetical protein CMH12_03515 [Maritimibacter sp.]|nr:hypothetical protein [Maritimibacter sp.]
MTFRGLTWDHPRGRLALERAGGPVTWDVQPLEGFESAPIRETCANYDLVVLDHPHLGEALNAGCLRPLDELFAAADLDAIGARTIGPCLESYEMAGRLWALPLDAATQVMAVRGDMVQDVPRTWDAVLDMARAGGKVGLSLAGPHAFLSFLSVAQALNPGMDLRNGDVWVPTDTATQALAILGELARLTPEQVWPLNPIGILDLMSNSDALALCPLVYGYVNYADHALDKPIDFHDAPSIDDGAPGSILGGTGIAVSTRCEMTEDLRAHLLWLMREDTQTGFIPQNAGQPSARAAWQNADVNAPVGGFYAQTTRTLETASIRPRHDGFIAFQSDASALLREGFQSNCPDGRLASDLADLFSRSQKTVGRKAG